MDVLMLVLLFAGFAAAVGYVYACVHATSPDKPGVRQP